MVAKPSVTLLGTGGPRPEADRGCTSLLIRYGDDTILIDAGRGVVRQLVRAGVDMAKLNVVLITHHHLDHIGELHDIIISSWLLGRRHKLKIYGPPETRRIVDALMTQVFDKDIEFRVDGEPTNGEFQGADVIEVTDGVVCETPSWKITSEIVEHGTKLDFSEAFRARWICLGFRFACADGVIAFSGDTVDCPGLERLAEGADVLVQCCYLAKSEMVGEHMLRLARYTLACADTVGLIAKRAGARKLVLTHHRQKSEEMLEQTRRDVALDFDGEIFVGQDLMTIAC
jgi:ribonuclease BN (tRNA processing enzyme)